MSRPKKPFFTRPLFAFTMIELLIVISIIGMIMFVASPSLSSLFQRQLLRLSSAQMAQNISDIRSNSFLDHKYYKFQFSDDLSEYSLWIFLNNEWTVTETYPLKNFSLSFIDGINVNNSIVYGPNGGAFKCLKSESPTICKEMKINETIIFSLSTSTNTVFFNILPINGIISSNYVVQ